jgi:hypothetical protein
LGSRRSRIYGIEVLAKISALDVHYPHMSDHWIGIIPRDPNFVPTSENIQRALDYLRGIAPDSDEVTFSIDPTFRFRDCGQNLESILCPRCRAVLNQEWWDERMSEDCDESGDGFRLQTFFLPCCSASANLNELIYSFDQGFSCFILEAMNPNIGQLAVDEAKKLSELLGTDIRVIYQHI